MKSKVNDTGHGKGTALEQCINNVQRYSTEHEHELDWFGNTSQEGCQSGRNKHGFIEMTLVSIYTAIHSIGKAHQEAGSTNHLTYLEAGWSNGSQQLIVRSSVTCFQEVDKIVDPSQP